MTNEAVIAGKKYLPQSIKSIGIQALRRVGTSTATWRALPDFVILGTKRGGTTSLWNYLLQHPHVLPMMPAVANTKSPHYYYWHYNRGLSWYRGHFPTDLCRDRLKRATGHTPVTGEASPLYMYDPRVPERIGADIPHARLIILLRDPVERAYSHYKERLRAGVEPLSFEEALAAEDGRLAGELDLMRSDPYYYSRPYDWYTYRDRGVYLPQIQRWWQYYPADQILILRSEDLYADPASVFNRVISFLGLPSRQLRDAKRYNYKPADAMSDRVRRELTEYYAPYNAALERALATDLAWSAA